VTTDLQLSMSLSDIARLAQVQRPVVSMWRRRSIGSDAPFPAPLDDVSTGERFDAEDVVGWLEATGRGNNREVRSDAPAHTAPEGLSLRDPHRMNGLTALLCLREASGQDLEGRSALELRQLAASIDPTDWLLRRELDAVGSDLPDLAAQADHLAEAEFGSARAFDGLLARRFRHGMTDAVRSALATPAHSLVSAITLALARDSGAEPPTFLDPIGSGSDLFLSAVQAHGDEAPNLVTPITDTAAARLFRRRLRVHGHLVAPLRGDVAGAGPAVLITQLPLTGREDMAVATMLDTIDEIAVSMGHDQRAVVVAPASVLTDRLDDAPEQLRSRVLRAGRVRAMVRLPAGLVVHRSRQRLALWLLGPDVQSVAVEDRRVAVIDVSDEPLTDLLIGQIRDDVLAAMAESRPARSHSFSRARLLRTATILARGGDLVTTSVSRPVVDAAAAAVQVEALRAEPHRPGDALMGLRVSVTGARTPPPIPLRDARRQRLVRVLPGNRHGFDLRDGGNVTVIGVPELTSTVALGARRVDRLTFLGTHDAARLTEPGDVVFAVSPRPCALVDETGGSAVESPARVVRIDPTLGEGITPYVVAHSINAQPATSRAWQGWPLPRLPVSQVDAMASAMSQLRRQQESHRARLADLADLERTLVLAVTSGALALHPELATRHPDDKEN